MLIAAITIKFEKKIKHNWVLENGLFLFQKPLLFFNQTLQINNFNDV